MSKRYTDGKRHFQVTDVAETLDPGISMNLQDKKRIVRRVTDAMANLLEDLDDGDTLTISGLGRFRCRRSKPRCTSSTVPGATSPSIRMFFRRSRSIK